MLCVRCEVFTAVWNWVCKYLFIFINIQFMPLIQKFFNMPGMQPGPKPRLQDPCEQFPDSPGAIGKETDPAPRRQRLVIIQQREKAQI